MIRYQKERDCGYDAFLTYMHKHGEGEFIFVFGDEKIRAKYDTIYEDENEYEECDPRYEEYNTVLFKKDDGSYLEVNYLSMPDEVFHNGVLAFKKANGVLVKV